MSSVEHWSRRAQDPDLLAESDEWQTPARIFNYANERYGPFDLDAAAARWNHQCAEYFSKRKSGLRSGWAKRTWCNPPYSRGFKEKFLAWGRKQLMPTGIPFVLELACFLVPHDTADGYWRRQVEGPAGRLLGVTKELNEIGTVIQTRWQHLTVEKTELHGRMRYVHNDGTSSCRPGTARHSSALVVLARPGVLHRLDAQTSVGGLS